MADEVDSQADTSRGRSSSGLEEYRFTFNCSTPNSRTGSIIEPDPDAENIFSSSKSLSESVLDFPHLFGRRYHAYRDGSYAFPNDIPEQERMNLQNDALYSLFGNKYFFAPLPKDLPIWILDIATGTGDWPIAVGDLLPHAQIVATDLSPIQPQEVPPNVSFYVEDMSEPWGYSQKFDYVHSRNTAGCWSDFETQIAQQAYDVLSPGGWFESQELEAVPYCDDGTLDGNSAMGRWFRDLITASAAVQRPITESKHLRTIYEKIGFVDVQEKIFKIPMNGWPKDERLKDIGKMWELNMHSGLSGFSLKLFNSVYGRTPSEIEVALVDVRHDLSDTRIHAYLPYFVVWGRKPYSWEIKK